MKVWAAIFNDGFNTERIDVNAISPSIAIQCACREIKKTSKFSGQWKEKDLESLELIAKTAD